VTLVAGIDSSTQSQQYADARASAFADVDP
jgi:hypothetical protein